MASPPAYSPAGSPPYSSASLPASKKRNSTSVDTSSIKRRKTSVMSATSAVSAHPLRQTSFPPEESGGRYSPTYQRSPSADNMSLVSGSQVSAAPAKKKRGRKSKAERAREAAEEAARGGTPSAANGAAPSIISNASGAKKAADDDDADGGGGPGDYEDPDNLASRAAARTKDEIKEEERIRALLKQKMDDNQFHRYEVWHQSKIQIGNIRKYINSVTSQSVAANIPQAMQVVCKLFLGDMIEEARRVHEEEIRAGVKQTDLPDEKENEEGISNQSKHRRQAPLRPEHLAEAYRRWKASGATGGSGGNTLAWSQQTKNGTERFAARAGGRRVFR
ncbi:hypothetical protein BKA67DRAFT_558116 [Truncatella angustata]|uniref:TAFII28-like protein domain-containing protein n=1 Tax=Truncatella angustata TaxID=152316 RepID=A0A9P9A1L5_9PEZI|nr:uncharacterized protein BKA67DRAFT_558116 [Truncatella angustata]KAH6658458.1 hypothetical protein BKA67DRAFT_558116 [Truncatella angustata]KAH8201633.1 hypothetical protein TruAng_004239 [Truncatella angustata]